MKLKKVVLLVLGTILTITMALFKIALVITMIMIKITFVILLIPLMPIALFFIAGIGSIMQPYHT